MRVALSAAVRQVTGSEPSPNLLAFMLAQTAMETANWGSIQNWNVGNITLAERQSGRAWRPPWFAPPFRTPRDQALHAEMLAGKAPKAFAAYDDLEDGALGYVERLHVRFPEIVVAAEAGDARKVAIAINKAYCPGCFGAAETRNLRALAEKFGADQTRQPVRGGHFGMWVIGGMASLLLARGLKK